MNKEIEDKIISYPTSHDLLRDFAKWLLRETTEDELLCIKMAQAYCGAEQFAALGYSGEMVVDAMGRVLDEVRRHCLVRTVFVVGAQVKQIVDSSKPDQPLLDAVVELLGVFDTEDAAITACTQRHHFIGQLKLNERLPDKRQDWPGAYFPKTTNQTRLAQNAAPEYEWRWQGQVLDDKHEELDVDEKKKVRLKDLVDQCDLSADELDLIVNLPVGGVWHEPLGEFPTSKSTVTRLS